MEIGSAALNILVECWDGHLTPPEVASLADRASRARDLNMVRAAAELALSCLPHAHALNPNEIQRALVQCKEQVPAAPSIFENVAFFLAPFSRGRPALPSACVLSAFPAFHAAYATVLFPLLNVVMTCSLSPGQRDAGKGLYGSGRSS